MRLGNLILSAAIAVFTLIGCSKESHSPVDTTLKTVELSFQNIILTKGPAGDKINSGDPVKVSNFKVFLTDGSYSPGYPAKNLDGTDATFYFTSASDLSSVKQFHFVDHKCTKVVVVANAGDITFEQVMALNKGIAEQQSQTGLILYGEADLSATGKVHTQDGTDKYTEVYEANVALKPTIARFEVDGFVTKFSATPKFNNISVTGIAFQHYFPQMGANTTNGKLFIGGTGAHVQHVSNLDDQAAVFGWFNGASSTGWFVDKFNPALEMTPADNKADVPNALAYHFYAGEAIPQMMITLTADGSPAYIYANTFKNTSGTPITTLAPGKIYRMSAAGEVATDGSIEIPDDLDPIQRCLDITVTVEPWVVEIISPEF